MTRFAPLAMIVLGLAGCNQCGERPRLLSRLRESDQHTTPQCQDGSMLNRGTGYGNPAIGYPMSSVGTPIYAGQTYPVYPQGDPLPALGTPTRSDELPPPGSYINPPGVPFAPPRAIESRTQPRPGGSVTNK